MTAKAKKLQLRPAPIMWTLSEKWMPETTERDGLRFKLRHDYYSHRATEVLVYRASDDLHIESIRVDNHMEAENVVRTWDLEDWRARQEEHAQKKVERALSDHREAMTRLNFVRGVRLEAPNEKVLTVWQPWASLIAHGWKGYEFRPKPPPKGVIGERAAIHAAGRSMKMAEIRNLLRVLHNAQDARQHGFSNRLEALRFVNELSWSEPPFGAFVCTAVVGAPLTRSEMAAQLDIPTNDLGDFNYAIPLRQVRSCPHILARGWQGWWNVPGDIAERIAQ